MPTTDKRPLKVFLCHASTDKPKVRELYRYLKKRGIQPWFDEEDLVGGQDWQVEIPKALATSDAIIICLTKNSVDKEGYIQKEIKFALDKALEMPEGRIFLIPVKFEECEVPFTLSRYQWVDLTVESGYAKMMKALKFRASQLERSTVEVSKKEIEEENLAREKAEKAAAEKVRLEAEELEKQKAAKEKAEREADERAERERKELREKQARETREKAKRVTEKKEEKPVTIKPKAGVQIAYWFGGFAVLVLGIIFLSSLNIPSSAEQPTPENTQMQTVATLPKITVEPNATATPKSTSTPASTFTPAMVVSETSTATLNSDNSKKLYFLTMDKVLNELDVVSGDTHYLTDLSFSSTTNLSWLNENEILSFPFSESVFSEDNILQLFDVTRKQNRNFNRNNFYVEVYSSDVSSKGQILIYHVSGTNIIVDESKVSFAAIDNQGNLPEHLLSGGINFAGYYFGDCYRWSPDASLIALVVSSDKNSSYTDLALLRPGPGESPTVIKSDIAGCVSWSPDGKFIAYGKEAGQDGIYYTDYITGSVTKLTDTFGYNPVWSPDGKKIAFITPNGISLIDVNTKEEIQIYSGAVLHLLWEKQASPSLAISETPISDLTSVPTVNPVTAILSANPRQGKYPLTVNFSANLKLSDGTLVCKQNPECNYFWQVNGNSAIKGLSQNVQSFTRSITYSQTVTVTVCYRGMCDSDSAYRNYAMMLS